MTAVHILDGGSIEISDWSVFNPDAPAGTVRRLSDPVYLVVHDRGTLVWDAGLSDAIGPAGSLKVNDFATFHVNASVAAQLAALGHPAPTISFLAISHFHSDHVGNVDLFPDATLLVQGDEYDSLVGSAPTGDVSERERDALAALAVRRLDGDYDVFGDGTVVIKRLPGHTIGSQSLLVRPDGRAPVLISGDLVHSRENWEKGLVPQDLNFDVPASLRSMDEARRLLTEEKAELWIQHDLEQYEQLVLAAG